MVVDFTTAVGVYIVFADFIVLLFSSLHQHRVDDITSLSLPRKVPPLSLSLIEHDLHIAAKAY